MKEGTRVMKHTRTLQALMAERLPCRQVFYHQNYYLERIAKTFACVRRTAWFRQVGNVPDSISIMELDQNLSDFTVTVLNNQLILPKYNISLWSWEGIWTKIV